uniref:Neur_chan_memb domain-containing protein n=1 Tax=Macrostomum lignano TaxID=282301 RepID=A0A1I8GC02_9PLAT
DKYVLMSLAILCIVSIWHAVVTMIQPPSLGGGRNATSQLHHPRVLSSGGGAAALRDCLLQGETGEPCSKHLRRMEMVNKIEKDVFISFGALYVLAHVIFIFWLYYDACRRRREMHKKDREYKNKIQFYQMVETHGRAAKRKSSTPMELMKNRHHHHQHRRQHSQLTNH